MNDLYIAIYDLLAKYAPNYTEIRRSYQNGDTLPLSDDFIVITELDSLSLMIPQQFSNQSATAINYNGYDASHIQLDFYGNMARDTARNIKMILASPIANNFLEEYGYSIGSTSDLINMSNDNILDRQSYTPRFILKFDLLNNVYLSNDTTAATSANVNIIYADTVLYKQSER